MERIGDRENFFRVLFRKGIITCIIDESGLFSKKYSKKDVVATTLDSNR